MQTINVRSRRIASFGLPRPHVTVGETHARCASAITPKQISCAVCVNFRCCDIACATALDGIPPQAEVI